MKQWCLNFILCALGIALAVLSLEASLQLLGLGYGGVPHVSDPTLHHAHPKQYQFPFFSSTVDTGGHTVIFDHQGYRIPTPDENELLGVPSKEQTRRVAIMGDSFVVGKEVPYPESFIGIMHKALFHSHSVKNFGVSSYSPSLYSLQWKKDVAAYKPDDVILLLYSNDISNDSNYLQNAVYDEHKQLVAIPGPNITTLHQILRKLRVYCALRTAFLQLDWAMKNWRSDGETLSIGGTIEETPDWAAPSSTLILSLAQTVQSSGANFYLSAVPSKAGLEKVMIQGDKIDFSHQVQIWAEQHGIRFIDLSTSFEAEAQRGRKPFFVRDIHFNRQGHLITGKVFSEAIQEISSH